MGLEIESGRRTCQNCRQCHISANKPKRKNKIIAKYTGQVHGTCIQKKAKRRFFNPIEKGPVIPRLGVAVFVRSLSFPLFSSCILLLFRSSSSHFSLHLFTRSDPPESFHLVPDMNATTIVLCYSFS